LSHSISLFFVMDFFPHRVFWTIHPGWLWTLILLISASWVVKITGVSHRRLARQLFLIVFIYYVDLLILQSDVTIWVNICL
jgi:hypothetical protein